MIVVDPLGDAAKKGIPLGSVVLGVNGVDLGCYEEIMRAIEVSPRPLSLKLKVCICLGRNLSDKLLVNSQRNVSFMLVRSFTRVQLHFRPRYYQQRLDLVGSNAQ